MNIFQEQGSLPAGPRATKAAHHTQADQNTIVWGGHEAFLMFVSTSCLGIRTGDTSHILSGVLDTYLMKGTEQKNL